MSSSRSPKVSKSSSRLSSNSDVSTSSSKSSSLNRSSSVSSMLSPRSGSSALAKSAMSVSGTGTSSEISGTSGASAASAGLRFNNQAISPPTNNKVIMPEPIMSSIGLESELHIDFCFSASRCICSAFIISSSSCCSATCVSICVLTSPST